MTCPRMKINPLDRKYLLDGVPMDGRGILNIAVEQYGCKAKLDNARRCLRRRGFEVEIKR